MLHSKTILVVDVKGINRLLPGLILRPFGWAVHEVDSGLAVLEALKSLSVDCVLLDISMPEISGLDVLQLIRKSDEFHDLTVVAYTAYATPEDAHHLVEQGFDAVLIKPLTSRKLLDILNEVNAS
jgi:CheY-like chemotaxis protein